MTYNALNGISIEQLNDEISRIYTEADQLFGNIDYSDLNYATAKLLERYTKEFNQRKGKEGSDEDITYSFPWRHSYTRPIESEDGTWTGKVYEAGYADIRAVVCSLIKTTTEPASAATRVYYPHEFKSVAPLVFYAPIMMPQPLTTEWVQNRRTNDIFRGVEILADSNDALDHFVLKEKIREAATTIPQGETLPIYTTDQVQNWWREVVIMAIGLGDYELKGYIRPDYVSHR